MTTAFESEFNGNFANRDTIGPDNRDFVGSIAVNDVDYVSFYDLAPGTIFTAQTVFGQGTLSDPILGRFDDLGNLIAIDDDSGGNLQPLLSGTVAANGFLNLALGSGGSGSFTGSYTLHLDLTINGTSASENLSGSDYAETFNAFGDDDFINAFGGNDTVNSGSGDDFVYLGAGNDFVSSTASGDDTYYGEDGNDYISGFSGNEYLSGDNGNDSCLGGAGNDTIYGGNGNDSVDGMDGNDYVNGDAGNDTVRGGTGNDTVLGWTGNDTVTAGDGNDSMTGGIGNDSMVGGSGNDTMTGGAGSDTLTGGTGNDRFDYNAAGESTTALAGRDRIITFDGAGAAVGDRIDLADLYGGVLTFRPNGGAFNAVGQVHVVADGANSRVEVNLRGSLAPDFAILIVDGGVLPSAYTAVDFFL